MKKRTLAAICMMTVTAMLTACGGGSTGGTQTTAAAGGGDKGQEQASAPADGQVVINFMHKYCQPEQAPAFERIVQMYMDEHPNVKINIETTTDNEIKSKLKLALGSGDMPDVYQTWAGEYTEKFIRAGAALDLTPYMEADPEWKDSFIPAAYSMFKYTDGGQYAVPTRFDGEVFIYKKSVFEQYGIEEPKTWDELLAICETLKSNGVTPFILGDQLSWDAPHWFGALWQKCVPEDVLEQQDFNVKTVKIDDPGYITGLNYFTDLLDKGYFNDNINSMEHNMALEYFYAGQGAMMYVEILEFNDINKGLNGDFGFFMMPTIEAEDAKGNQNKMFGAPEGMIVNPNSQNVDVAVDFVKFLTSPEMQKLVVEEAGHTSSTIGAHTDENTIPQLRGAMDAVLDFEGMSNWTDCGFEAGIVDTMCKLGQDFVDKSITAEEYIKGMQESAKTVREANAD